MSLDVFKGILAKFQGEQNVDLNLFGGEPLLNREIIDYVIGDDFVWLDFISVISINTNGTYLSPEIIHFAQKNNERVIIDLSLDGNKEIHDFYRKDNRGEGSYDSIEKNILNIKDFSNYNINFCVSSYASDKLFDGVQNLVTLGFKKIKLMFLYENFWSYSNFENLCRELVKLRKYKGKIDINIFNSYDDADHECRDDFLDSFIFLPSGELVPCPVWISKQAHKVVDIKPFFINQANEKRKIIKDKVFGNKDLSSIMDTGAICESIQGNRFTQTKKIIESLIIKVYNHE